MNYLLTNEEGRTPGCGVGREERVEKRRGAISMYGSCTSSWLLTVDQINTDHCGNLESEPEDRRSLCISSLCISEFQTKIDKSKKGENLVHIYIHIIPFSYID